MLKRNEEAKICLSASNPRRVVQALLDAIDEARAEGMDDETVKQDPACILILSQAAHLLGGEPDQDRFGAAYDAIFAQERV